jgi:hypothetical protein
VSLKKMNYPKKGETGTIFGAQAGGVAFTIEADADGCHVIGNFKNLLVGTEPISKSCKAGTLVFSPGNMKMYCMPGVLWGLVLGPAVESTVPKFQQFQKTGPGKKLSNSSREVILELPGEQTVTAYRGRHKGLNITKLALCTSLFEEGANGQLEPLAEGLENLLKLLNVPGLELTLSLVKKIPAKSKILSLNMFAQHPEINDGNKIMLWASAPVAGMPLHILQKGVLPGNQCLKDLMKLPWPHELREKIEQLMKPLVDFAVHMETSVMAKKWKKDVTRDIPQSMVGLTQALARLYKSQSQEKVEHLLSCVKTGVAAGADGEGPAYGLVLELDSRALALVKGKTPKETDEESESEDEDVELFGEDGGEVLSSDDSDEERGGKKSKGKGKSPLGKRPYASPARSARSARSSRSSPGSSGSGSSKKKKPEAAKKPEAVVVSDDEEDELGSEDEEDEEDL